MDLFSDTPPSTSTYVPLAERLRPQSLDDVIGQTHLLGPNKPLRLAFESGRAHSMILWGPPGVGKTTLARLMAKAFDLPFVAISAVLGSVKDIRAAVDEAQGVWDTYQKPTLLFVDEVHRFNKSQQDAFLPYVESGLFIFVGATTENPSFEVVNALLSRATVYQLQSLNSDESKALLDKALKEAFPESTFTEEAQKLLIDLSDGDARRLLNTLDVVMQSKPTNPIEADTLRTLLPSTVRRFDKGGDAFYDLISALHKSVRGSDPDAALYWYVRMLDGGADPMYIARRLMRMAVEDIGIADPKAIQLSVNACEIFERLGSPEGELALAQAVVYLACAPKSNAVYKAFNQVKAFVKQDGSRPVPMYLRNAPTKLMKDLGYHEGYRYAHDEPDAFAAGEIYLPEGLEGRRWYEPVPRGVEFKIDEKLARLRQKNEEAWQKGEGRLGHRHPSKR